MTPYRFEEKMFCKKCGIDKPTDGFYASNHSSCKECVCASVRSNRREKFDYYSQYERKRYAEQPERRAALTQRATEWRKKNPDAYKAQTAVGNALRDGKLQKSDCLFCGAQKNIHAHHNDYSRPLDVIWLCAKCHHRMHANFPEVQGHGDSA